MSTLSEVIFMAAIVIAACLIAYGWSRERSKKLRARFGPEYDAALNQYGSRPKAEKALADRTERMEKIQTHPLSRLEQGNFVERWRRVQALFVDDPMEAVQQADRLVGDVMRTRGYPVAGYERRVEDLSVDYPNLVNNYRSAHDIFMRLERKETTTEDLRQAMVSYRNLFDELLEAHTAEVRI